MKKLLFFLLFTSTVYAEYEMINYVGVEGKMYPNSNKERYNLGITFQNQSKYKSDLFNAYLRLDALKDFKDEKRDEFLVNELYILKSYGNFDFTLGRQIVFLGSLEAYNIVNILNPRDFRKDMFSDYRLGVDMASVKYYFEDDSNLALYLKLPDRKVHYPSSDYEVYPFGEFDYSKKIKYDKKKIAESLLTYNFSISEDEYSGDFSFGIFNGYDGYKLPILNNDTFDLHAFKSLKYLTYLTFMYDDWLIKLEAIYTNPYDNRYKIDNFYESGIGFEYSFENIYKSHTLGIVGEYFKSDSNFTSLENDIFVALRYSLSDKDSSEFLLGFLKDIKNKEGGLYLKYDGRLIDNLKISSDFRYTNADKNENVRFGVEVKYYF